MVTAELRADQRVIPGIGTLEYEETESSRAYWLLPEGGKRRKRLPSVTTILGGTWPKPALLEWYRKHGNNAVAMRDAAAHRGKSVHAFVEGYLRTGDIPDLADYGAEIAPYITGAARFLWQYQPEPIAIERLVCHPEFGYAGRLDLIASVMDVPTLLDFKTNAEGSIYPEAHVQATAYAIADERCGGEPVQATLLVGISDTGDYFPIMGRDASKLWAVTRDFYRQMGDFKRDLNGGA